MQCIFLTPFVRIDSKLNDLCCSHLILWSMIIARATTIKVSPRFYRWSSSNADAVIIISYLLAIMCFSLWTDFVNINSSFVCTSSICTFCLFFLNRFPCVLPDYDVITISISRSCLYYDECSHRILFSFRILGDRSIRSMFSNTLSTSKSIYIFFVCFKICCCRHFGALKGWHTKRTQSYQIAEQ